VREVAAQIPLWKFMVERPIAHICTRPLSRKALRTRVSRIVAETIAAARHTSFEEIAEATTETAEKFFQVHMAI